MIRNALTPDQFDYKQEQLVRKKNLTEIKNRLKKSYIVISDDLNYYSSMRHDLKLITEELKLHFFIIHISTPLEICLQWNEKRGRILPDSVIKNIALKFDTFDKYKWDYPLASINLSEETNFDSLFKYLMKNITFELKNVYNSEKKEVFVQQASEQYNERLDKITRTTVGEILKNSEFIRLKNQILKYRKLYVKRNRNKFLEESIISKAFKEYLEESLNIKLS